MRRGTAGGQIPKVLRRIGLREITEDCDGEVTAEPISRERLDHYGNDGEGWDHGAWEEYAGPLRARVREAMNDCGLRVDVEVSEKGHVHVTVAS